MLETAPFNLMFDYKHLSVERKREKEGLII